MVSQDYARGWDDCLEAVKTILAQSKTKKEIERKIDYVHDLVKEKKFEGIKLDLGIFKEIF